MVAQPGDFGLVHMPGWPGRLIGLGERLNGDAFDQYDHAVLRLPGDKILEAEPGGARIMPADEYGDTVLWSYWDLTNDRREALFTAALKYVNTPYSAADYFALAAKRLHIPAPGLRRYVASSGHMICSQLVDQIYADAGLQMFDDGRWPGYVTPASLHLVLGGPI